MKLLIMSLNILLSITCFFSLMSEVVIADIISFSGSVSYCSPPCVNCVQTPGCYGSFSGYYDENGIFLSSIAHGESNPSPFCGDGTVYVISTVSIKTDFPVYVSFDYFFSYDYSSNWNAGTEAYISCSLAPFTLPNFNLTNSGNDPSGQGSYSGHITFEVPFIYHNGTIIFNVIAGVFVSKDFNGLPHPANVYANINNLRITHLSSVPLPPAIFLFGSGLLRLFVFGRSKKKQRQENIS